MIATDQRSGTVGHFGYTAEIAKHVTAAQVVEMREWIADCEWREDADDLASMSTVEIVRGIEYHYDGGVNGFLVDSVAS